MICTGYFTHNCNCNDSTDKNSHEFRKHPVHDVGGWVGVVFSLGKFVKPMCFPPCLLPHTCRKGRLGKRKWEHLNGKAWTGWSFRKQSTDKPKERMSWQAELPMTWATKDGRKIPGVRESKQRPGILRVRILRGMQRICPCLGMDSPDPYTKWARPLPRSRPQPHTAHSRLSQLFRNSRQKPVWGAVVPGQWHGPLDGDSLLACLVTQIMK